VHINNASSAIGTTIRQIRFCSDMVEILKALHSLWVSVVQNPYLWKYPGISMLLDPSLEESIPNY